MDDLQLNISVAKKSSKNVVRGENKSSEYKFVSKPNFTGKTIARKRPQNVSHNNLSFKKSEGEPQSKVPKQVVEQPQKSSDLDSKLRDLSENKGRFHGKNYQDLSDDIQLKQKPRSGGWISSLFKNNPDVPRLGQRLVKPIVEKVFAAKTFVDLDLHPHSVANLEQNLKIKEIMIVQQNAIPIILQGRDVLIRSQTGSGKTLAYALPVIEGLQAIRPKINRHDGIRAVVVVPTRELAVQTYELFIKLVKPFTWVVPGLLSGGQKRKAEKARLRKGLNILIGTPGRINDHLRHTKSLNFAKTGCLILDEADRLLDMGYEKDVAAIVKAIEDHKKASEYDPMALMRQNVKKSIPADETEESKPGLDSTGQGTEYKHNLTNVFLSKNNQTILLSATLTKAVENLAGITLVVPVFVDTSEGRAVIADSLKLNNTIDVSQVKSAETNEDKNITAVKNKSNQNTPQKEIKENENKGEDTRRGLKAFSGLNHPELFKNDGESSSVTQKIENKVSSAEDSDSDSDYEYFKVQKQLEDKKVKTQVENVDVHEDDEEPSNSANTFQEALKTAITEDELVLPASVNQTFLIVPMKLRLVTLCSLIVEHCVINKKGGKMIIFMATLEMVDYHTELIETVLTGKKVKQKKEDQKKSKAKAKKRKHGDGEDSEDEKKSESSDSESEFEVDYEAPPEGGLVPVDFEMFSLHGSMPHEQRMEVFKQFRAARSGVLICTDVAARGLDVPRVDLVLQYCAPSSATDYVHRVGRTGRATRVGAAVMFLLPSEAEFIRHLEKKRIRLRQSDEKKVLEALLMVAPGSAGPARAAIAVQTRLEYVAHSNRDWLARASRAYTSWVRFYSGYPREVREWLDAKQLHLGHAAKAFALRDTPAALARRTKSDPKLNKERPTNRLTVHDEEEKKRSGFPKAKLNPFGKKIGNKQSSMHTASEFDSGLAPLEPSKKKKKK